MCCGLTEQATDSTLISERSAVATTSVQKVVEQFLPPHLNQAFLVNSRFSFQIPQTCPAKAGGG